MLAAFQEAKVTAQYHVVDIDLEGARVRVAS
jgi:hypothetical protein